MKIKLNSGETASVEIIPRAEAIGILSRPATRHTWFGRNFVKLLTGSAGDRVEPSTWLTTACGLAISAGR